MKTVVLSVLALFSGCATGVAVGECVQVLGFKMMVVQVEDTTVTLAGPFCLGMACMDIRFEAPMEDVTNCLKTGACQCEN